MMVAPVAVRAQSWAEISSPATAEEKLTATAHENIPPAERAAQADPPSRVGFPLRKVIKRTPPPLSLPVV